MLMLISHKVQFPAHIVFMHFRWSKRKVYIDYQISYIDSMNIGMRSSNHDSIATYKHGRNFENIFSTAQFELFCKIDSQVKPIVLRFVDGGPAFQRLSKLLLIILSKFVIAPFCWLLS